MLQIWAQILSTFGAITAQKSIFLGNVLVWAILADGGELGCDGKCERILK